MTKSNMTTMYCHKKSSGIIFLNMTETWAPATRCRSPPPRSLPGSSHLRSPFLSVVTWNMEHHMDYMERDHLEQEHHMERDHVHDSIIQFCLCLSPNSLRMTAIFFPCWVVRMWVKRVVFPEENKRWISRMTNSCLLTWAKLPSDYRDWNLSKCY